MFICKEERVELLQLLRDMERRYKVSQTSNKYPYVSDEHQACKKTIDKITNKIDLALGKLEAGPLIKLLPVVKEKPQKYDPNLIIKPLPERLNPVINLLRDNTLSQEQALQLSREIHDTLSVKADIRRSEAMFKSLSQ